MVFKLEMTDEEIKRYKKLNRATNMAQFCKGPFFVRAALMSRMEEMRADFFRFVFSSRKIAPGDMIINSSMYILEYEPYINEAPEDASKRRKKK